MIVVGLVSFNSCVLYLSCYIGILVTCAVTCVDFVLCSIVVYCVCYVSVWMCHNSCCLIVLNIVLIYIFLLLWITSISWASIGRCYYSRWVLSGQHVSSASSRHPTSGCHGSDF